MSLGKWTADFSTTVLHARLLQCLTINSAFKALDFMLFFSFIPSWWISGVVLSLCRLLSGCAFVGTRQIQLLLSPRHTITSDTVSAAVGHTG